MSRRWSLFFVSAALVTGCRREPIHHDSAAPPPPPVLTGSIDVATLVDKVNPAVVGIASTHEVRTHAYELGPFGGGPRPDIVHREHALGSGFIIDASGYVVTNAHVVEDATDVRVILNDEREVPAKVQGRDRRVDLALLKLEGEKGLPAAVLGSSESLRVGENVVAIGNPFGLGHTVTSGIVSAKGRSIGAGPFDDFVQTDASINPGNSGGPLFNARGEVVGINTAIAAVGQGIGFAVPVDTLKSIVSELKTTGHVARGRLGVALQHVDGTLAKALGLSKARGALIAEVEKGSPAADAGLRVGDVVVALDGTEIAHAEELPRLLSRDKPGTKVKLEVLREGDKKTIEAKLGTLEDPEDESEQATPEAPNPRLGIVIGDHPGGGAIVQRVDPAGSAAGKLRPGDMIVSVNRDRVDSAAELRDRVNARKSDEPLLLEVINESGRRFVAIDAPR